MQTVTTKNFYAAAYLLARGVPLIKTTPGFSVHFVFSNEGNRAGEKLDQYYGDGGQVNAYQYGKAIRHLRQVLFQAQ